MISRRYLRIKVMQALYARQANPSEEIVLGEKNLDKSIAQCQTLSYCFFSILPEIKRYLENKFEDRKGKIFPTQEDLNPNTRFIDNQVIIQMENSSEFNREWSRLPIDWSQHKELIISLFAQIEAMPEYQAYMAAETTNYKTDKQLVLDIFEKVFAPSEILQWFFEEQSAHWLDDYNDALLQVYQGVVFWKAGTEDVKAAPLFKDKEEDTFFYKKLYRKTIEHDQKCQELIEDKLKNWESDRIIATDMILMKMAVCEMMEFPSIPVKVTINEYIEIAKVYGSEKSGTFINGIVDRIAQELRETGRLNKQGRGLLNESLNITER